MQRQPARRQQMECRRRRGAVDRDDVHAGQHLVEAFPIGRLQLVLDALAARGGGCGSGSTGRRPWRAAPPRCRCGPCRRCRAACPRCAGRASRSATSRPICRRRSSMLAPSVSRRGTASISAIVMSAVSSVSTFGVLVTVMPLLVAAATSILSTPLPKLAISLRFSPACAISAASMRSVMVGTSTSASFIAADQFRPALIGRSSTFSRASNSSRMRVSTGSGSLRVMTTRGFFLPAIVSSNPDPASDLFNQDRRN